jgi:peptidoglycan/xylan/chitin deacetylase (PgdA/CDA1 family)
MSHRNKYLTILMYHALRSSAHAVLPETSSIKHTVEASEFRAQLDAIVRGGYRTIGLDDLDHSSGERKDLLITFDDGHESDLLVAAPELAERKLHAVFFIIASYLGRPGYLTRDQLVALRRQGFEIGSHGLTHTRLTHLSPAGLSNELVASKQQLEDLLQEPITSLAIPFGRYNDSVLEAAAAAGYRRIMTSDFRIANRERRLMPRMGSTAATKLEEFAWMLKASRADVIRRRAIEALGIQMRRLARYGEALLTRAQNMAEVAKSQK